MNKRTPLYYYDSDWDIQPFDFQKFYWNGRVRDLLFDITDEQLSTVKEVVEYWINEYNSQHSEDDYPYMDEDEINRIMEEQLEELIIYSEHGWI